ncbi:MAG: cation:proton antiporter, partial [Actinoallomurus sp.]
MGVPGIAPHDLMVLLAQLSVLLGLAHVLGRAAARAGTPPVAGELLAGVVAGPSLLGALAPGVQQWIFPADASQMHMLEAIAQFGALLLVGMTGVEVDLPLVRRHRRPITMVSVLGLIVPLGIGILAGFYVPSSLRVAHSSPLVLALFVGTAVGISSIPVVAKILAEMRLIDRTVGQVVLMSAALGDVVAWLMLSVVAALAVGGAGAYQAARAGLSVACVFVAAVALRPVLRRAIRAASASGDRHTTAVVVITVLG